MFHVKIIRPGSSNVRTLPRRFATIAEASSFLHGKVEWAAVYYADGTLAKRIA